MEGVGARLGRSSTRYGPVTVFNGPVRKWKKKWVHASPSSSASSNSHSHNNLTSNGNNGSHLLLYKWTPITQSHNNNGDTSSAKAAAAAAPPEEPPRRKFKYVPVAVLEQKNESTENEGGEKVDDEANLIDADPGAAEPYRKNETLDEKPDINDVPMEESQSQDKNQVVRQDLNESTLDLSLCLTSRDDDHD